MSIQVVFEFQSIADAKVFVDRCAAQPTAAISGPKTAAELGAGAAVADPTGGYGGSPLGAVVQPPAPPQQPPAPPQQPPAPPAPPAQPAQPQQPQPAAQADQATLIGVFTELGKAKGRDTILQVLERVGASTVIEVPPDKYAEAISLAQQALAS